MEWTKKRKTKAILRIGLIGMILTGLFWFVWSYFQPVPTVSFEAYGFQTSFSRWADVILVPTLTTFSVLLFTSKNLKVYVLQRVVPSMFFLLGGFIGFVSGIRSLEVAVVVIGAVSALSCLLFFIDRHSGDLELDRDVALFFGLSMTLSYMTFNGILNTSSLSLVLGSIVFVGYLVSVYVGVILGQIANTVFSKRFWKGIGDWLIVADH